MNLRRKPASKWLHNVVVLWIRQKDGQETASTFAKHTCKQSPLESLELAKLSNDLEDIVPRSLSRKLGSRLDGQDTIYLKGTGGSNRNTIRVSVRKSLSLIFIIRVAFP